jgi:hypothetical protein
MLPSARVLSGLGLLAVVPAAAYLLGRSDLSVALAGLNTLIIVWSVATMVGPVEGDTEDAGAA